MSIQKILHKPAAVSHSRKFGGAVGAYRCMTINTSGELIVCSVAGEFVFGINGPNATTATTTANNYYGNMSFAIPAPGSIIPVVSGSILAVKTNIALATDANGAVIAATSSHAYIVGYLLTAAAVSGDIVSIIYQPGRATAIS